MQKLVILVVFLLHAALACVAPNTTFEKLPPGIWRGALLLDRVPVQKYGDDRDIVKKFDVESELPFNFEVVYDNDTTFHMVIHNADERIKVDDIKFGRDISTAKDTIIINFPVYDTRIEAIYEDGVMEGDWIVNYKDNYRIPFKAIHGVSERFPFVSGEVVQIDGRWDCTFEIGTEDEYKAVGIFKQNKGNVTGTFLTETGDYRFLDGKMDGKKLYLSAFDGAHAFLFSSKLMDDGKLSGVFRSGSVYKTNWEAEKNDSVLLTDSYHLTKSVSSEPLSFSFKNTEGNMISLNDEKYIDKIKIIQIMGTWCPNCMDETLFLKEYFQNNLTGDVALITIGFERYKDENRSVAALQRFKSKLDLKHEVLYGGYYDKKMASQKIPQLDKIMSYPTLIITDRKNKILKIHTGFSGPATPGYNAFRQEFAQMIKEIAG